MLLLKSIIKYLMEKETQFIPQKESPDVDTLFKELGSELDFGTVDSTAVTNIKVKHPLEIVKFVTGLLVSIAAV